MYNKVGTGTRWSARTNAGEVCKHLPREGKCIIRLALAHDGLYAGRGRGVLVMPSK